MVKTSGTKQVQKMLKESYNSTFKKVPVKFQEYYET